MLTQYISSTLYRFGIQRTINRKPFKFLDSNDLLYFRSILPSSSIITQQLEVYNKCWRNIHQGKSKLVLLPQSTQQVSSILKYCNNNKIAVVPQGGNTGLVGGSVPVFDEIIINMKLFNKINSFSQIDSVLTCQAGTILQNANDYIQEYGFEIPLDLGAKGSCFLGGNAATNAGGKYVIKNGSFRSNILGLQAVLPNGQILDLQSQIHKDNTGYDLKQLMIGSEGTLGIITKLNINCKKIDRNRKIIVLKAHQYQQILRSLPILKRSLGKNLNALQYVDGYSYHVVSSINAEIFDLVQQTDHLLFIEIADGDLDYVENILIELPFFQDMLLSNNQQEYKKIWAIREDVAIAARNCGKVISYDISFKVENWYGLLQKIRKATGALVLGYGHIGDGNLHLNICMKQDNAMDTDQMVFEEVAKGRGSISAEHGVGLHKGAYLHLQKSKHTLELMRQIKQVFDPNGIMNPYKVIPLY